MSLLINVNGKGAVELDFEIEDAGDAWCEHVEATLKMALSSWMSTHGGSVPTHMQLLRLLNSIESITPEDEGWSVMRSADPDLQASTESDMFVRFSLEGYVFVCERR